MNFRQATRTFRAYSLALALWLPVLEAVTAAAYDSPDFTTVVFSADGIFLAEDQRTSLLEALAAIASNFPNSQRVDDDLREKALAIALRLDPMHYHSRMAHRSLLLGETPRATAYFTSLSQVSEALWTVARQLITAPLEPEQIRFAPYVMELSLVIHPDPPDDRLELFGEWIEKKPPAWERFTTLQPDSSHTGLRTRSLRFDSVALRKAALERGGAVRSP